MSTEQMMDNAEWLVSDSWRMQEPPSSNRKLAIAARMREMERRESGSRERMHVVFCMAVVVGAFAAAAIVLIS